MYAFVSNMSSQARHISPLIISYSLIHTASKERGGEVLEAPSKKERLNFVHVTLGQNIMTLSVKIKTLVYKISGVFQELNKRVVFFQDPAKYFHNGRSFFLESRSSANLAQGTKKTVS